VSADATVFPRFSPAGDSALLVELGDQIDLALNRRLHALADWLRGQPGLGEAVPGYASLLVHYDPLRLLYPEVLAQIQRGLAQAGSADPSPARRIEIPLRYGGEDGPDLDFVARHCGLSAAEVIRRHSQAEYVVYFLGFTPGFPYLGGMDPAIAAPRLETPRTRVPAGSVGIAANQTGLYPFESPGGWRIIGRTSAILFDPLSQPPALLAPGDVVRFIPQAGG
jgi:5-oxoprolinase (ATP-hydrolysing) subunit B